MKNPDNRALLRFRVLVWVPKAGSETGSSIRLRMSVNSDRNDSAVSRDAGLRKLSRHQLSTLKSSTRKSTFTISHTRSNDANTIVERICFWVLLTRFPLAPFEGVVDVDEGEVVSLRVVESSVTLVRFVDHASRGRQETARCW